MRNDCKKRRYTTEQQAEGTAILTGEANRARGDHHPVHHYLCPCGFWHVGHVPVAIIAERATGGPYQTTAPIRPLSEYVTGSVKDSECRVCGYRITNAGHRRGRDLPWHIADHEPVPIPVIDRECSTCGVPVVRTKKDRTRWRHDTDRGQALDHDHAPRPYPAP